jgi:hypothetical protein
MKGRWAMNLNGMSPKDAESVIHELNTHLEHINNLLLFTEEKLKNEKEIPLIFGYLEDLLLVQLLHIFEGNPSIIKYIQQNVDHEMAEAIKEIEAQGSVEQSQQEAPSIPVTDKPVQQPRKLPEDRSISELKTKLSKELLAVDPGLLNRLLHEFMLEHVDQVLDKYKKKDTNEPENK